MALRRLLVPASVLVAQAGSLLVQLLVPRFLVPAEYSKFAVAWSFGQFFVVLCYEWIRISVLRFSDGADREIAGRRRAVLKWLYLTISGCLLACGVVAILLGQAFPFLCTIGVTVVYTACRGLLDGAQAYARARFMHERFAFTWMLNSIVALILTGFLAWLTGSGLLALLGMAMSFLLSLTLHLNRNTWNRRSSARYEYTQFRFLFRYGALVALTACLSAALPPTVRWLAVTGVGSEGSAGLLLALDISQKVVGALGMSLNLVLIQDSIRSAEHDPEHVLAQKVRAQTALCAAVIFPAGLGFVLVQSSFARVFVPEAYRASYMTTVFLASICASVFSFRSFGVDSLFVVAGRSRYSAVGPFVALITAGVWVITGKQMFGYSLHLITSGLLAGLVASTLVSMLLAQIECPVRWPFLDFAKVGAGCFAMYVCVQLIPSHIGIWHAVLVVGAGTLVYVTTAFATDLCGLRTAAIARRRRRFDTGSS